MNSIGVLTFSLAVVTLFPQLGLTQGRSDRAWQSDVFLHGLAAAISGDAQLGPVQQPVDVSFGEILDNLQMGFIPKNFASYAVRRGVGISTTRA